MAKKKKESFVPDPTPEKQLESKSGWCMTDYHKSCPQQFSFGRCGCECHKKGEK